MWLRIRRAIWADIAQFGASAQAVEPDGAAATRSGYKWLDERAERRRRWQTVMIGHGSARMGLHPMRLGSQVNTFLREQPSRNE